LLNEGCDVNGRSILEESALQAAASGGHSDIIRLLLEKGADVNAQGFGGRCQSALEAAVSRGHRDTVRLLLEKGADVNVLSERDLQKVSFICSEVRRLL
ncbi:ankyrin repeat-containing domain protein, partial [Sphaerosporella brunnea]